MLKLRSQKSTQEDFSSRPVNPNSVQAQGCPNLVVLVAKQGMLSEADVLHSDALSVPETHAGVCC